MLSASKLPLFFWAEEIATAYFTQNRSLVIPRHEKTPYHIINDQKPSVIKHLYIFGCICYITRDGKNLDKMKEKGDLCILVGYSTQSKGYHVYNKRTRMIVESIHIRFDEIKEVSKTSVANETSGLPTTNIQPTSAPSTPTYVHAEENNDHQAEEEHLPDDEFNNPFCALAQEVAESSSHNISNSNVPTFNQPQVFEYRSTKDHPLEQVCRNPSRPVQTRTSDLLGTFINQAKYTLEILHKHGMEKGQSIGTPMATKPKLDADLSGNPVDQTDYRSKIESLMYLTSSRPDIVQVGSIFGLIAFSNADHAGCINSRKSTSEGIQFLGDKLVSWMSKKQNCTTMSSAKAKYLTLSASCAQVMWMRTQLRDYGFNYNKIPLYCDSQTEYQLADMFIKALPEDRFKYLVRRIGMRCLTPAELEVLAKEYA
nr:hypothetical protein [Tanacetum cinerariifolium]